METKKESRDFIIYKLTNKINNKIYIGQTKSTLEIRWNGHTYAARHNSNNMLITKAIRKYGPESFLKESIELNYGTQLFIDDREEYWIKFYDATNKKIGYNILLRSSGRIISEEYKKVMSLYQKKAWNKSSPERKKKQIEIMRKVGREVQRRLKLGEIKHGSIKHWKFYNTNNNTIIEFDDLANFCRQNNLNHECMRQVFYYEKNRVQSIYKGFTAYTDQDSYKDETNTPVTTS